MHHLSCRDSLAVQTRQSLAAAACATSPSPHAPAPVHAKGPLSFAATCVNLPAAVTAADPAADSSLPGKSGSLQISAFRDECAAGSPSSSAEYADLEAAVVAAPDAPVAEQHVEAPPGFADLPPGLQLGPQQQHPHVAVVQLQPVHAAQGLPAEQIRQARQARPAQALRMSGDWLYRNRPDMPRYISHHRHANLDWLDTDEEKERQHELREARHQHRERAELAKFLKRGSWGHEGYQELYCPWLNDTWGNAAPAIPGPQVAEPRSGMEDTSGDTIPDTSVAEPVCVRASSATQHAEAALPPNDTAADQVMGSAAGASAAVGHRGRRRPKRAFYKNGAAR